VSRRALWRFLALTGCRRGEALGLTRFALDLDAGTARIERQLVPLAGRLEYVPPKSDSGVRTVRLDAGTVSVLRRHLANQELERTAWGDAYRDEGLVFCREDGSPLDPRGVSQMFQVRRKAAGLPKLTLHGLRHSAATHLALTVGAHRETVRAALGHSSTRTTEAYYTHALDEASQLASDALAAVFDGSGLQTVSKEEDS
jgi:integrase